MKSLFFATAFIASCWACNTGKVQTERVEDVPAIEDIKLESTPDETLESPTAEDKALLIGIWQWEKTICCGRTPNVISADSSEFELFLEFRIDSTVVFYHDEDPQKVAPYSISKGIMVQGTPEILIEGERPAILRVTNDELILDYSYIDLQTEYYRKVDEVDD